MLQIRQRLGFNKSTFYYQPRIDASADVLRSEIQRLAAYPTYGYRRITKLLVAEGPTLGDKRVARLMKEENLTLKAEEVHLNDYQDITETRERIGHFIIQVYHQKRPHAALRYLTPMEFQRQTFS